MWQLAKMILFMYIAGICKNICIVNLFKKKITISVSNKATLNKFPNTVYYFSGVLDTLHGGVHHEGKTLCEYAIDLCAFTFTLHQIDLCALHFLLARS